MSTADRAAAARRNLPRANQIRLARAELKRRINRGEVAAAAVIADLPEEAMGWPVVDLLSAQHGWGSSNHRYGKRARRTLRTLDVPETKPVGELTERQRERIVKALGGGQ